ncbi:MAG: ABC-type transport auxiliary lipoprotein family protein [Verrucomicrobiota bacterium]
MKPFLFFTLLTVGMTGCVSLQPVSDTAERFTLILEEHIDSGSSFAAPVFEVSLPSYLNEGTIWYSDPNGRLYSFPNFVWAESLNRAVRRELAIALSSDEAFHPSTRINVYLGRFNLLSDGSGIAVAEVSVSGTYGANMLPAVAVKPKEIWNPDEPKTFLKGYQKLLSDLAEELSKEMETSLEQK